MLAVTEKEDERHNILTLVRHELLRSIAHILLLKEAHVDTTRFPMASRSANT